MSNDLISRNDLKEDFKKRLSNAHKWLEKAKDEETKIRANAVIIYICEVIMTIDNAPTVEERPQGKWIEHWSTELSEKGYYQCSKCKAGFQRFERGTRHSDLPWIDGQKYELHCIDNFCPNCGADMQKGDAE